jgi:glycosyltransferase involved in cell wall biosynthesis
MCVIEPKQTDAVHFYLPNFAGGGAERVFIRVANHLASRDTNVILIVNNENGPLRSLLDDAVTLKVLNAPKALLAIPKLITHLRETKPVSLISALTRTNVAALLAARLAGVGTNVIVCERNTYSVLMRTLGPARRVILNLLVCWLYPSAKAVIGNTERVRRDIVLAAKLELDKTGIIHNPAPDLTEIAAARTAPATHPWISDDGPVAVAIGRLVPQKDYNTMIAAIAQSGPDLRLLILGDGPDRASLAAFANEVGVGARVEFLGFQMDRFAYLVAADVFLISSITEGFPNALMEAVSAGIPAVSTDCAGGGAREIMGDELSDWIVPVGDSAAMAAVIQTVLAARPELNDHAVRDRIAQRADRFHIDRIVDAFLARALS